VSKRSKTKGGEDLLRGRFAGGLHPALDGINRSFDFDRRLWRQDIRGSIAHAEMLGARGIAQPSPDELESRAARAVALGAAR